MDRQIQSNWPLGLSGEDRAAVADLDSVLVLLVRRIPLADGIFQSLEFLPDVTLSFG